jgi:hypothetical protein
MIILTFVNYPYILTLIILTYVSASSNQRKRWKATTYLDQESMITTYGYFRQFSAKTNFSKNDLIFSA